MLHDFINPVKTQIKRSANERARSDDLREGLKLLLGVRQESKNVLKPNGI